MTMHDDDEDDKRTYMVVKNDEDQYSIWCKDWHVENKNKDHPECKKKIATPEDNDLPIGWYYQGVTGLKPKCLDYIGEHWTDMRPRSLREFMEANGQTA